MLLNDWDTSAESLILKRIYKCRIYNVASFQYSERLVYWGVTLSFENVVWTGGSCSKPSHDIGTGLVYWSHKLREQIASFEFEKVLEWKRWDLSLLGLLFCANC